MALKVDIATPLDARVDSVFLTRLAPLEIDLVGVVIPGRVAFERDMAYLVHMRTLE